MMGDASVSLVSQKEIKLNFFFLKKKTSFLLCVCGFFELSWHTPK